MGHRAIGHFICFRTSLRESASGFPASFPAERQPMRSVLTILAGACCASLALAQPATGTKSSSTTTTVQYHRSSTVIGTSFMLGTESVGKVTEVVFNDGGCIEYLVVQDAE